MPVRSMPASTVVSGSSSSRSSRVAPRWSRSSSSARARSATARARTACVAADAGVRLLRAAVQGELAGVRLAVGAQVAPQVAQDQVGEVEGALAGQRQVGRQRGVAGDPRDVPAAGVQRQQHALQVVHGLRHGRVGQPVDQRPLVHVGERLRVHVRRVVRLAGLDRQADAGDHPGAPAPRPAQAHADPAAGAGVLGQPGRHVVRAEHRAGHVEALVGLRLGRGQRGEQPLPQHPELQVVEELVHLVAVPLAEPQVVRGERRRARRGPAR